MRANWQATFPTFVLRHQLTWILACATLVSFPVCSLFGQSKSGNTGRTPSAPVNSTRTTPSNPNPSVPDTLSMPSRPTYLNGRVMLDQGSAPPESVIVEEVCSGTVRAKTHTDSKGNFTILPRSTSPGGSFDPGTISAADSLSSQKPPGRMEMCDLRADVPGFTSSELHVQFDDTAGVRDVGTIFIKPLSGAAQGATISVTSLQVPSSARSEYNKGIEAVQKGKQKQAQEHLLKAVGIYPNYAAAWVSLGRLYESSKVPDEARNAYTKAIAADSHYLPPYLYLAFMAARDKQWEQVLNFSGRAIELDPTDYYEPHFLSAVAHFNLQQLPEAEKAALKAEAIDKEHREARVPLLLARIYELKGDPEAEANQLRAYLKAAPNTPDAAMAKANLEKIEQKK